MSGSGSRRIAGGLALVALALQNLSNGYFLVYAALWLPPYVLAQMALRARLHDRRAWLGFAALAREALGFRIVNYLLPGPDAAAAYKRTRSRGPLERAPAASAPKSRAFP